LHRFQLGLYSSLDDSAFSSFFRSCCVFNLDLGLFNTDNFSGGISLLFLLFNFNGENLELLFKFGYDLSGFCELDDTCLILILVI
jgi:hypothetical protein